MEVFTGSGYELLQWQTQRYDTDGRVVATFSSDGSRTDSAWSCCGKASDTGADGRTAFYAYDDLNRVTSTTQQGVSGGAYAAQGDIKTVYTYDGLGRTTQTLILAGDLSQTTHSGYDSAGRLLTSTDAAGLKTTYYYSADNLASTVTAAGGATQTTTRHRDGRIQPGFPSPS